MGTEAALHSANEVLDGIYDTGFILVDARNAFNEVNRYTMLWMVRNYGLVAVGLHPIIIAAGAPFLSDNELGRHFLSSQRQGSPRDVLSPCRFTNWIVYL